MSKNEIAKSEDKSALPAHLQQGRKTSIGNLDSSDLIIPRVKLLQAISPEVTDFNDAKPGNFWHTIAGELLGPELVVVPILVRKSAILWSPRNDDRGILARSSDGKHWDPGFANLEFEVKHKGMAAPVKYATKGSVAESGLLEFGSMVPGDPKSPPAASLTYNWMFYFPDHPELSPAIVILTRSGVKASKNLYSKMELRPVEPFYQRFTMKVTQEQGDEGPYFGYSFVADGYVEDEDEAAHTRGLYERFSEANWVPSDENEDPVSEGSTSGGDKPIDKDSKF